MWNFLHSAAYLPVQSHRSFLYFRVLCVMMDSSELFFVGKTYENVEKVKEDVTLYNTENYTDIVVRTNNKKSLLLQCKHGRERKSECSGSRPKQHYNFLGCEASITLYKSQKSDISTLKITKVNLSHNHPVNEEIQRLQKFDLSEDDKELLMTLREANAKPSQIKRVLSKKRNKDISTQRIKNLIQKLSETHGNGNIEFIGEFLRKMEEDGGTVDWMDDSDGSVKAMFLSTINMKSAMRSSDPTVVQMDTTFEVDKARYKLAAFCYLNTVTDKTEVGAFAFMSDESKPNYMFVLSKFFDFCGKKNDLIFLVDKDFTNIDCITSIFRHARILLCIFHVLKFMRTLISTALTTVEKKSMIFQAFKQVLYSHSASAYVENVYALMEEMKDVEVRVNQAYVLLSEYYSKNWEPCNEMWIKFHRYGLPLLGDNTTNRIERMFWTLKQSLYDTFSSLPNTHSSIIHLLTFADNRLTERYNYNTLRTLKIFDNDKFIRDLNEKAAEQLNDRGCVIFHQALKAHQERSGKLFESIGGVLEKFSDISEKVYAATIKYCNCTFFMEHQAPCRHIIFCRKCNEFPIFDKSLFHARYHRDKTLESISSIAEETHEQNSESEVVNARPLEDASFLEDVESDELVLTDREKYKMVMPILVKIGNLISCHPTKKFMDYLDELETIEKRIRTDSKLIRTTHSTIPLRASEESISHTIPAGTSTFIPTPRENLINAQPELPVATEIVNPVTTVTLPSDLSNTGSRFDSISFKTALKAKGRPKKKSRQVTFKKTVHDKNPRDKKRMSKSKLLQVMERSGEVEDGNQQYDLHRGLHHSYAAVEQVQIETSTTADPFEPISLPINFQSSLASSQDAFQFENNCSFLDYLRE